MALARRCDGLEDCADESDEFCSKRMLPLNRSYRPRPHRPLTLLNLTVGCMEVLEVDAFNNEVKIKMEVRRRLIMQFTCWVFG